MAHARADDFHLHRVLEVANSQMGNCPSMRLEKGNWQKGHGRFLLIKPANGLHYIQLLSISLFAAFDFEHNIYDIIKCLPFFPYLIF